MFANKFFSSASALAADAEFVPCAKFSSDNMAEILATIKDNSCLILDLDDTVERMPQTIGLDAWFRFRLEEFNKVADPDFTPLERALKIYNASQFLSTLMIPVDLNNPIAPMIEALKARGVKVVALTARNNAVVDKTLQLLVAMGVSFCTDVLKEGEFSFKDKVLTIKGGVIFANGNAKGDCLERVVELGLMTLTPETYPAGVTFIDDAEKHVNGVAASLDKLGIPKCSAYHYTYAEKNYAFGEREKAIAKVQENALMQPENRLLSDDEAQALLDATARADREVAAISGIRL